MIRRATKQNSSFLDALLSAETLLFHRYLRSPSKYSLFTSPKSFFYVSSIPKPVKEGNDTFDHSKLIGKDLSFLTDNIKKLASSSHPLLNTVSNYYFSAEGKKLRPLLVILMSRLSSKENSCSSRCLMLATITELIHTASLLHDDVIDQADKRRGLTSAHLEHGNKLAILAGDYLLSRASVALARLRDTRVVELLAEVIGDLVEGEVLQMSDEAYNDNRFQFKDDDKWLSEKFSTYLKKSYMKTASLVAKSCQASILLNYPGNENEVYEKAAYEYGMNLGLAFQLVDDCLDFVTSDTEFGKPSNGYDLKLGLATAPVLYAYKEHPSMKSLIERKFKGTVNGKGDTEQALEWVLNSDAIRLTKGLSSNYVKKAIASLSVFPDNEYKDALTNIAEKVISRKK